ncbi:MAG: hypothetical protein PVI06_09770 [Desulfobacterales bacterium]|jgi:hypothetical protein
MMTRMILIFIFALIYLGCAAKPVKIEFAVDHPANPSAPETAFLPIPNPFEERTASFVVPEDNTAIGHDKHKDMQMHHQKEAQKNKESHKKPVKPSGNKHSHGEHN